MTRRELGLNLVLTLAALLATAFVLEGTLRIYHAARVREMTRGGDSAPSRIPTEILCGCSYLYALNPDHPDISSQGLRDREVAVPKPDGVGRILVLGDSVAFGAHVPPARTFPNQLEARLGGAVEVLNASVSGYTTYNEVHYYLDEGRRFEPDLVILTFVLNDAVNPRLHWNYTREHIEDIPPAAIPNPAYDREHVLPILEARRYPAAKLGSELVGLVDRRLKRLARRDTEEARSDAAGWPTFLTAEDSISVTTLTDADSPEWRWLRALFDRLRDAVERDGARLVVVPIPLAYQLAAGYPYRPQDVLAEHCRERGLSCPDPLPAFREHAGEELFVGRDETSGDEDVWHLTDRGHELVATELERFLRDQGDDAVLGTDRLRSSR